MGVDDDDKTNVRIAPQKKKLFKKCLTYFFIYDILVSVKEKVLLNK